MRDAVIGGQESGGEDFACVDASEMAGFGDRMEDLSKGVFMNGKVVD